MYIDDDGWLDQAVQVLNPYHGGTNMTPLVVVNHWTAGFSPSGSVKALEVNGLSAHFVIGRDGGIIQTVSCNRRAFHAGESEWRGRRSVNGFSIGIEWCNLGPVEADGDGGFSAYGKPVPGAVHVDETGKAWELLSDEQIDVGHRLHKALAARYPSIVEAVDHHSVAPTRKIDMIPWQGQVEIWGEVFLDQAAQDFALPGTPKPVREREGFTVREIQAALNKAGYHLTIDGIVGSKTLAAIIDFQRKHRLLHVGVVNDETAKALGLT